MATNGDDGQEVPAEKVEFKVPSLTFARPKHQHETKTEAAPESVSETAEKLTPVPPKDDDTSTHVQSAPPLSYNEPSWSSTPSEPYSLTVIKNGSIIQEVQLSQKPFHVFGRLPSCDVQLEHPSVSRYHAVLQYRPDRETSSEADGEEGSTDLVFKEGGFFVYDLGSTHGTYVNKKRIQGRCYCRLRLGQMVKFGGSSRLFLLEGSHGDQEQVEAAAEDEISEIVQQKEVLERRKAEMEARERLAEKEREDMGVMWGIVTDDMPTVGAAGEDYDIDEEREAYYKDDPKKALKKCFDREGLELEYEVEEEGPPRDRVYTVRVRLPMDAATGEAIYAEASLKGKKKEAVQLCALNACRMLDAQDMLRHSAKVHKRKKRDWAENDYYDSDEDTFLDRTGLIEKKRKKRMRKAGALEDTADNYESLQAKLRRTLTEISSIEKRLARDRQGSDEDAGVDSLEAYMDSIGSHLDRGKRLELKQQLHSLINEKQRLTRLLDVAKSAELPVLKSPVPTIEAKDSVSGPLEVSPTPSTPDSLHLRKPPAAESTTVESEADQPRQVTSRRKKGRVIGPALPPPAPSANREEPHVDPRDDQEKKHEDVGDYADWLPPPKQTGDGRTHLNDKFGY